MRSFARGRVVDPVGRIVNFYAPLRASLGMTPIWEPFESDVTVPAGGTIAETYDDRDSFT